MADNDIVQDASIAEDDGIEGPEDSEVSGSPLILERRQDPEDQATYATMDSGVEGVVGKMETLANTVDERSNSNSEEIQMHLELMRNQTTSTMDGESAPDFSEFLGEEDSTHFENSVLESPRYEYSIDDADMNIPPQEEIANGSLPETLDATQGAAKDVSLDDGVLDQAESLLGTDFEATMRAFGTAFAVPSSPDAAAAVSSPTLALTGDSRVNDISTEGYTGTAVEALDLNSLRESIQADYENPVDGRESPGSENAINEVVPTENNFQQFSAPEMFAELSVLNESGTALNGESVLLGSIEASIDGDVDTSSDVLAAMKQVTLNLGEGVRQSNERLTHEVDNSQGINEKVSLDIEQNSLSHAKSAKSAEPDTYFTEESPRVYGRRTLMTSPLPEFVEAESTPTSPRAEMPIKKVSKDPSERLIKRPYSATKIETLSVREDAIRTLVATKVELENDFLQLLDKPQFEIQSVQHLLSAGATVAMMKALLEKVVIQYRQASASKDVEDFKMIPRMIRAIRIGLSARSRGPSRFFCFSGKDASIEVSGTSTFAKSFPNSWGFAAWIWISSTCGPFTVASFLTKERYGVSVTLVPDENEDKYTTLLFESADEKKRDGARISVPSSALRVRSWHHLYISQNRKRGGASSGTILVRIDDKTIDEKPLAFPGLGLTSPITKARVLEDFDGLAGPVWIIDGPLKLVTSLARQQVSPILAEGEETAPALGIFNSRVDQDNSPPVFASYHPERVVGNLALDLHGSHLGTLGAGCLAWTILPAREALRNVGGATALLPFLRFDASHAPTVAAEAVLQSLLLIAAFLEGHGPNQLEFFDAQGIASMACALEALPSQIMTEMLKDPSRDLVSALNSVARAFGLECTGTPNEGSRLMRVLNWRTKSVEYELDRLLIFNLAYWVDRGADADNDVMRRVVTLCSRRIAERPMAYRKRFGVRFFLDALRRMYEKTDEDEEKLTLLRRAGSQFVDSVVSPMLMDEANGVTREEFRAIVDASIGAGHGVNAQRGEIAGGGDPLRERRKVACWDVPTSELAHDALRLLVKLLQQPSNHSAATSLNLPSVLAVEVVAFAGLGERVRALALRVIGLALASSHNRDAGEHFANMGGFSYLSSALSYAVVKGEKRFDASKPRSGSFDDINSPTISTLNHSGTMPTGGSTIMNALGSPKLQQHGRRSLGSTFASSKPFFVSNVPTALSPSTTTRKLSSLSNPSLANTSTKARFVSSNEATAAVANSTPLTAHIGDSTYNALLSIVVTPSSITNIEKSSAWRRASNLALMDEADAEPSPSAAVLDDVVKIANVHALSLILDQLGHMSPLVQQRVFQDLFVLLKFEPENRSKFYSIPNWQRTMASFLATHVKGDDVGVFEMGVKLWVLILHDAAMKDYDSAPDVFWLGESFGSHISHAVLAGLLDSIKADKPNTVSVHVLQGLIRACELSPVHYPALMSLIDSLQKLPDLEGSFFALLMRETSRIIALEASDLGWASKAARRAMRLLNSPSGTHAASSHSSFGGENLYRDSAVCAVSQCHASLERFQGKTVFLPEEVEFLDSCSVLLVEAAKILSSGAPGESRSEAELIELASAMTPSRAKPMPHEAWLHSRWAMGPLDPAFSSLADATLDDLSYSLKRSDRERYDTKFSKSQERLATLAKTRAELETFVRDSEEKFVYVEIARLTSASLSVLNEKKHVLDRWSVMLKEMAYGETIWRDYSLSVTWTCPEREDYLRRHSLLEKQLDVKSHVEAAYESTLGVMPSAKPTSSELQQSLPPQLDMDPNESLSSPNSPATTWMGRVVPYDSKEEIVYVVEGSRWVTPSVVSHGRVEVSAHHVIFYAALDTTSSSASNSSSRPKPAPKPLRQRERWRLDELVEIHSRRYLLRPTAIELFFSDRTTVFFAFPTQALRDECSSQILKQKPARLEKAFTGSLAPPALVFKRSKLTEMWRRREISNFEYLMRLNTIAGRTYNDVTQFFVFPWVLVDYDRTELDLDDQTVFRDLTKPVGALNAQRMQEVCERYEMFTEQDMGMPAFHHGSHYSSAGVVLHYLIRVEPYTTMAIELQGGRFDVPDRLFFSVKDCFKSCYSSIVDCRELIPEFFYLPEMFLNRAKVPLGKRQDGHVVDDVILPAWANNDAELFVRMNREALESEYVSENLHNWIDLIFGFKQRGKDAVEACNVFNYLSYEGAVDLDAISDPNRRAAVELQILEFGQCPSQLLTLPHPKRLSLDELGRSIAMDLVREAFFVKSAHYKWNMLVWRKQAWQAPADHGAPSVQAAGHTVVQGVVSTALTPVKQMTSFVRFLGGGGSSSASQMPSQPSTPPATVLTPPVVSISAFQDRLVLVHADMTATVMHIVEGSEASSLELRPGTQIVLPSSQASTYVTARPRDAGLVGTSLGALLRGRSNDFVCTQGGNLVVSSCYFDGSIRCFRMDGTKIEFNVTGHRARVSALAHEDRWLVSGSLDGTAVLWRVGGSHDSRDEVLEMFGESAKAGAQGPLLRMERHLTGHQAPVTAVAVSQLIGVIATGAQDGSLLVHALYDKSPARTRRMETGWKAAVDCIAISAGSGGIAAHSKTNMEVVFFSVNGQLLGKVKNEEPWSFLEAVRFHEHEVIIGGGDRTGEIWIRRTPDLAVTRRISYAKRYRGVRCASVAPNGKYVFVGCADGSVIALGDGTGLGLDVTGASAEGGKKGMIVSE